MGNGFGTVSRTTASNRRDPCFESATIFAVNCFEKTNNELNEAGNGLSNESAIKLKGAQNKTILT